jgi:hypothetical protein
MAHCFTDHATPDLCWQGGYIKPITTMAVAHDNQKMRVILRKNKGNLVKDLLERPYDAIANGRASGKRGDEINKPSADARYEV